MQVRRTQLFIGTPHCGLQALEGSTILQDPLLKVERLGKRLHLSFLSPSRHPNRLSRCHNASLSILRSTRPRLVDSRYL